VRAAEVTEDERALMEWLLAAVIGYALMWCCSALS